MKVTYAKKRQNVLQCAIMRLYMCTIVTMRLHLCASLTKGLHVCPCLKNTVRVPVCHSKTPVCASVIMCASAIMRQYVCQYVVTSLHLYLMKEVLSDR